MTRIGTALLLLVLAVPSTAAADVVAEFSGEGGSVTRAFAVKAPWLLTWVVRTDYHRDLGFDMDLREATTGRLVGRVLRTNSAGGGYKLFEESGRFQFAIQSSFARWTLRVEAISAEEAAKLIPVKQPGDE